MAHHRLINISMKPFLGSYASVARREVILYLVLHALLCIPVVGMRWEEIWPRNPLLERGKFLYKCA